MSASSVLLFDLEVWLLSFREEERNLKRGESIVFAGALQCSPLWPCYCFVSLNQPTSKKQEKTNGNSDPAD